MKLFLSPHCREYAFRLPFILPEQIQDRFVDIYLCYACVNIFDRYASDNPYITPGEIQFAQYTF